MLSYILEDTHGGVELRMLSYILEDTHGGVELRMLSSTFLSKITRGCSSAGRAPALHAGGQEFESLHLHQISE